MEEFATRLKELRIHGGFTQKQVAEYLNIRQQSYARYETNKGEPSLTTLISLAKFYHVTLDYLCGLADY